MTDSKSRKFLKPLSLAVAAVVASVANEMVAPEAKAAVEKVNDSSVSQLTTNKSQSELLIHGVDSQGVKTSYHGSHSSHSSHASHSSSRW
jgi:hypothetical protein